MNQNQNKRTLRTIGLVVAVTLLTKILGIVREALQAGVFGTQTAFDLYTISYNYTIYIFTTVAYALCIAAVPVISRHLAEDRNKAFAVAGNLICVSVLVSALVVVLLSVLIRFAPVGIFGLVANTFATTGAEVFIGYIQLLVVLLGSMFFVALVINPFLVWFCTHKNPFPVTLMTLRESGVAAFFTRSSAANIPVNLEICRRLGLPESTYSISIPVGATINMAGAAITITVLTLSAAYSLNIPVDLGTAVFLSFVASICACGASGVAGGSLLLIPVACASFGIGNDISMQVVGVGFIISVLEDACETALNSSSDVLFTATAEFAERRKNGTLRAEDMRPRDLEDAD